MAEISFQGKTFEVDEDGFLLRFDDWCPEWMEFVKAVSYTHLTLPTNSRV